MDMYVVLNMGDNRQPNPILTSSPEERKRGGRAEMK
jgi:hypothetical protein